MQQDTSKNSYIQLLNAFWQLSKSVGFTTNEIALYTYLLDINNSCYWKSNFSHNNSAIKGALNISFKTLAKARKNLSKYGLISFETQNGSPNVLYQLSTLSQTLSKYPKVKDEVRDEIKKNRERVNNIIEGDVDFNDYREYLKSDNATEKLKSIYALFKLQNGTLAKLFNQFELTQKATSMKKYSTIEEINIHFVNWLNIQETFKKLGEYKHHSIKQPGSL